MDPPRRAARAAVLADRARPLDLLPAEASALNARGLNARTGAALCALVALLVALAAVARAGAQSSAPAIQTSASPEEIEPPLSTARGDRGRPDRCPSRTQLGAKLRCIYGKRRSNVNAVVFGDSKVMQYFPALNRVAHRRGWRLVGLMRAGCPPASVRYAYACDKWRRRNRRRLERINPELVITSSSVAYQVVKHGRRLSRKASRPILRREYMRTLRQIADDDTRVAVVINPPRAPHDPVACVKTNIDRLDACAFQRGPAPYRTYVTRAARKAGVQRIDANQAICPGGLCPAVVDDVLVQRDHVHLTATYARTLEDWLDRELPAVEAD